MTNTLPIEPVSLLVPCHNAARFLPRLASSVRAQTQPFAEFLCFDDGSSDDTAKVAASLGATVLRGDGNRGAAHARNRLWQSARCAWVHFHDADDLLDPEFLAKMTRRIGPTTDAVICGARWVREPDLRPESEWRYRESELRSDPLSYLLGHPVGGINGLYRRATLARVDGYREDLRIWEDADLHVRLAAAGARFAVVEEILVTAVRREQSLSAPAIPSWRDRLRALESYGEGLPGSCRPALLRQIDRAASELLSLHADAEVRRALELSRRLGGRPPESDNRCVRLVRDIFGPIPALQLQRLARRFSS